MCHFIVVLRVNFDMWHNYEVTRVIIKKFNFFLKFKKILKNIKRIQKNQKLTCDVDFNTVWSKLMMGIKLSHF